MQITIQDHDTTVSTKRDNYRWNVVFTVGSEAEHDFSRNLCANFADWASFLQASGMIDFFTENDDNGMIYTDGVMYTFDQYIREQMLTGGTDTKLAEYVAVKISEMKQAA